MPKAERSYQDLKTELDDLVEWFETADIDIEEAVKKYKLASELVKELEERLKKAELSIKKLPKKS